MTLTSIILFQMGIIFVWSVIIDNLYPHLLFQISSVKSMLFTPKSVSYRPPFLGGWVLLIPIATITYINTNPSMVLPDQTETIRKDLACAKFLRTPAEAVVVQFRTRKLNFLVR